MAENHIKRRQHTANQNVIWSKKACHGIDTASCFPLQSAPKQSAPKHVMTVNTAVRKTAVAWGGGAWTRPSLRKGGGGGTHAPEPHGTLTHNPQGLGPT